MSKVLWIDAVGLTPGMIGPETPHLKAVADRGFTAPMTGILPGVTCAAQSTLLTGKLPRDHGIVGNGWYFREQAEVWLWRQSNRLVQGEKLWHRARRDVPGFSVCNMFWWYNMYADVNWSLTPRPLYFADGAKMPGVYGWPKDFRHDFDRVLPPFPLFNFWGPAADWRSTAWIIDATRHAMRARDPMLTMVYLPHLDYDLQRFGPDTPEAGRALAELDRGLGPLLDDARSSGRRIVICSEYGIEAVRAPVHINRALREAGLLETTPQLSTELLDPGASRAFAVADHQVAQVYVRDASDLGATRRILEGLDGVERVLDRREQATFGLDHERAGELVAVSAKDRWFSYYYWLDDARAPDFARCVDIHRKPGYDPAELFLDPKLSLPKAKIAWRVLKKKLGFRYLMDVIPLEAELVRGSHGRLVDDPQRGPILMADTTAPKDDALAMTDVADWVLRLLRD